MDFKNKVVIITGASAGIGADAALKFAKQSANLVLVGRNSEALNDVAQKCAELKGLQPLIVRAELTNDEEVKSIVDKTIDKFGKIDILVNNAGISIPATLADGVGVFDKIMNTNIRSAYHLTSLAVPYLIKSKGNIVNVSSITSSKVILNLDFLPYGMSKAAMDQFTRYLAVELGTKGVRVNSVNPGSTKTGFLANGGYDMLRVKEKFESYYVNVPLHKPTESDEVADLILYLASDKAKSITGSFFVIDNGEILV